MLAKRLCPVHQGRGHPEPAGYLPAAAAFQTIYREIIDARKSGAAIAAQLTSQSRLG